MAHGLKFRFQKHDTWEIVFKETIYHVGLCAIENSMQKSKTDASCRK